MFLQSFCVCVRQLFHFFLIERVNAPDFIHFGNCTFISTTHNFRSHSHISIIAMPNRSSCCCCFFFCMSWSVLFVCLISCRSLVFGAWNFLCCSVTFLSNILLLIGIHMLSHGSAVVCIYIVLFFSLFLLSAFFFLVLFYCFGCHHRVFCLIVSRSICGSDAYRIHPVARALSSYRTLCRALCLIRLSLHCDRMKWSWIELNWIKTSVYCIERREWKSQPNIQTQNNTDTVHTPTKKNIQRMTRRHKSTMKGNAYSNKSRIYLSSICLWICLKKQSRKRFLKKTGNHAILPRKLTDFIENWHWFAKYRAISVSNRQCQSHTIYLYYTNIT